MHIQNNNKMDLFEIECGDMDRIHLSDDKGQWRAHVNIVINLRVQPKGGNFLTSYETVSLSRGSLLHAVV
jgi:hypothetical protein